MSSAAPPWFQRTKPCASAIGATARVRPLEYGPGQTSDLVAEGKWDVVVDSIEELAAALGC